MTSVDLYDLWPNFDLCDLPRSQATVQRLRKGHLTEISLYEKRIDLGDIDPVLDQADSDLTTSENRNSQMDPDK